MFSMESSLSPRHIIKWVRYKMWGHGDTRGGTRRLAVGHCDRGHAGCGITDRELLPALDYCTTEKEHKGICGLGWKDYDIDAVFISIGRESVLKWSVLLSFSADLFDLLNYMFFFFWQSTCINCILSRHDANFVYLQYFSLCIFSSFNLPLRDKIVMGFVILVIM